MATTTPKEFAQKVNSDARTVRKFLRDITPKDEQPGKGSRWAIENKQISVTPLRLDMTGYFLRDVYFPSAHCR